MDAVREGVGTPLFGEEVTELSNGKSIRKPFAGIPIIGGAWTWSYKQGDKTADFFGF